MTSLLPADQLKGWSQHCTIPPGMCLEQRAGIGVYSVRISARLGRQAVRWLKASDQSCGTFPADRKLVGKKPLQFPSGFV